MSLIAWSDDFTRADYSTWLGDWYGYFSGENFDGSHPFPAMGIKDNQGRIYHQSMTPGYGHYYLFNSNLSGITNAESRVSAKLVSGTLSFGLLFRSQYSEADPGTYYKVELYDNTNLRIVRKNNYVGTTVATKTVSWTPMAGETYYIKGYCKQNGAGTDLKVKVWRAGDAEPEYTDALKGLTASDSDATLANAPGETGIAGYAKAEVGWDIRYDDFSLSEFATDSGAPVVPPSQGDLVIPEWTVEIANASGVKVAELSEVLSSEWRWDKKGGCSTCTLTLPPNAAEMGYMVEDYWVTLRVKDPDTLLWDTWWTGYLEKGHRYSKSSKALTYSGVGFSSQLAKILVPKLAVGLPCGAAIVVNTFLTRIASRYITGYTDVASLAAGWSGSATCDELAFEKASLVEILNAIGEGVDPAYTYGLGATWGVDEDRILFSKATPSTAIHTLHHESPYIKDLDLTWDNSGRVNSVYLTGGASRFPNLVVNPTFAATKMTSSSGADVYDHFDGWDRSDTTNITYVDNFTTATQIILHDNNVVSFGASATTSSTLTSAKGVEVSGYPNAGKYDYYLTLGAWACGRFYSGTGAYIDWQLGYATSETGAYTYVAAGTSQWASGDYSVKKAAFEVSLTGQTASKLYWKVRIKPHTAGRQFWVDGLSLVTGKEKTTRGAGNTDLAYMMGSSYEDIFQDGTPSRALWGEVSPSSVRVYREAKKYSDAYFDWYNRVITGGTLTLRSYAKKILPWEGSIQIVSIPKTDGTYESISFPVETVTLSISKDAWESNVTIGDPVPGAWDYIAKAWVKSRAYSKILEGSTASVDHTHDKEDAGLGSVLDTEQLPSSYLDTDTALAADSDTKVASQHAVKTYIDAADHWDRVGTNLVPETSSDTIQPGGYKSSDGTAGVTADIAVAKVGGGTRTLHFKNGLYTGYTDS